MDPWPSEGFKAVAEVFIKEDEVINRDLIIDIAINMHMDTISISKLYYLES